MSALPTEFLEEFGRWFPAHPAVRQPTVEEVWEVLAVHGDAAVAELARARSEDIERLEKMPFEYPFTVAPLWDDADRLLALCRLLVLFGGNRSSKTRYAIDRLVRDAVANPGRLVLILHETEQRSKLHHQKLVYQLLPTEWKPTEERKIKRTLKTKIAYSVADGFSGNILAMPNGSVIQFGFYTQDIGGYEGGEYDWIFGDENLPLGWLKTLLFRLYSRKGKMLWAFTAIHGITPAMAHVVNGATTAEHVRAELLPATHRCDENQDFPRGHVPYVQHSVLRGVSIIYFHTRLNPFAGYEAMAAELGTSLPPVEIERRFYGFARNLVSRACPLFSRVHLVKPETPPENVTWWNVVDPAGKRNFFLLWGWVDEHGRIVVWDEWPSVPELGEWAVAAESAHRHDGEPGPAQAGLGWGVPQYKRMMLRKEGWRWNGQAWEGGREMVFRWGDPRAINQAAQAVEAGGSTLMERFAEEQRDDTGNVIGPAMYLQPAPGKHEDVGLMDVNNLLSYKTEEPVTALVNEPMLYVHERCQNLIWALNNYTGLDGEKAACKDPMDALRYVVTGAPVHVGQAGRAELEGGGW